MASSVLLFGDSLGKGIIFDEIQDRYRFLKDNFVRLFSENFDIAVKNFSSFGCTVTKGLKLLDRHIKELPSTEAVVLEFGGNDCDYNWAEVSRMPETDHAPKTPMDKFIQTYQSMIHKVRACGGIPILMNLPPIDAPRYFARVSAGLNPDHILSWLGDVERIYRWHEYYSLAIHRIALLCDTPLIDVRSAFLERRNFKDLICEDGIHPNAKGHSLICEVVSSFVQARGIPRTVTCSAK